MRSLPTIRTKLALVVLACVIPTVIGFGLVLDRFLQQERLSVTQSMLRTAQAMVMTVDSELNNGKMAALSLASSPYLVTNDLAAFHAQAKSLLSHNNFPGFAFALSDATAQQVVNTLRPFGEPLPISGNVDQVMRVFDTGEPVVSDLFLGGVSRQPTLTISVPVWQDGKIVYSLAVGFRPEHLGRILNSQRQSAGNFAAIFDSQGVIVARTHEPEKYIGQKGSPELLERMQQVVEGDLEATTLEGIPVYSFFSRSPVSGWTVAIGVPKSRVVVLMWQSLAWIGLVVLVLCSAGFICAWHIGGTIRRSVMALTSSFSSVGAEEPLPIKQVSFKEAEVVAAELLRHQQLIEIRTAQLSHDIAVRKRVEEQLHAANQHLLESERFTREIADNLPGLVSYWDTQLHCRFANKRYAEWYDISLTDVIGKHARDFLGEQLFALSEPNLMGALSGAKQTFERTLVKANGEVACLWANYIPDVDVNGQVVGLLALVSDVTALKQAEEAQRIAATAFESNEAMIITDANTVILQVNKAFCESTGYTPEEIVGKTPRVLKSGRHDQAFYAAMWKSIRHVGSWQGEIWNRRKNGELYPCWTTITAVKRSDNTVSHYVSTKTDITARKAAEDEIRRLAFFDVLTGLPNRRLLMDRLRQALATCARTRQNGALMFIDLDNFKDLNDTFGHDKGDLLLQQVASRLTSCVREGDTVARLGGDEFMVMLENLSENLEEAGLQVEGVGEKIIDALNRPCDLAGLQYRNTSSIGVTLITDHQCTIDELLKRADMAMYQAKAAGRNALRFFDEKIQALVTAHVVLDAEFRLGLPKGEFLLYFQPQVDKDGRLTGAEALVRWQHPRSGLLHPAEFIPLAEENGLIVQLGQMVLESACTQLAAWHAQPDMAHLTMAVNVSAKQFNSEDYVEQVLTVLNKTGAHPHQLKLEITESMLLEDVEDMIVKMTELQAHGVSFALDDFGKGYSSLAYLKRLPLNQLKIDQSFVLDMLTNQNDATIASAIVALGQNLELEVIAEGVETEEQRVFLAQHDCCAYQGFLFGPPLPISEFEELMKAGEWHLLKPA